MTDLLDDALAMRQLPTMIQRAHDSPTEEFAVAVLHAREMEGSDVAVGAMRGFIGLLVEMGMLPPDAKLTAPLRPSDQRYLTGTLTRVTPNQVARILAYIEEHQDEPGWQMYIALGNEFIQAYRMTAGPSQGNAAS